MIDFIAAVAGAEQAASTISVVLGAIGLLILGLGLLIAEFLVISFGILGGMALISFIAAIYIAFDHNDGLGWTFMVGAPIVAILAFRWGLARLQASSIVPKAEIDGNAGYRHHLEEQGIAIGSSGEMLTDAYPTGRARFEGGTCDVQVIGGSLEKGAPCTVKRIDGAIAFVVAAPQPTASTLGSPERTS